MNNVVDLAAARKQRGLPPQDYDIVCEASLAAGKASELASFIEGIGGAEEAARHLFEAARMLKRLGYATQAKRMAEHNLAEVEKRLGTGPQAITPFGE